MEVRKRSVVWMCRGTRLKYDLPAKLVERSVALKMTAVPRVFLVTRMKL